MSHIFYWPASIAFRETESLLEWAKNNCSSYITNDVTQHNNDLYYRFYFADERDLFLCILRWS